MNNNRAYRHRSLVREAFDRIESLQQAFIQLLSDPKSKQLAREACCFGLAACRGVVGADNQVSGDEPSNMLNTRLLRAFGQTTNYGVSAYMETDTQAAQRRAVNREETTGVASNLSSQIGEENEVGGASGMSEAALGAYREMAAASVSLGRPDVLYALMILSASHSCWFADGTRDRYR